MVYFSCLLCLGKICSIPVPLITVDICVVNLFCNTYSTSLFSIVFCIILQKGGRMRGKEGVKRLKLPHHHPLGAKQQIIYHHDLLLYLAAGCFSEKTSTMKKAFICLCLIMKLKSDCAADQMF